MLITLTKIFMERLFLKKKEKKKKGKGIEEEDVVFLNSLEFIIAWCAFCWRLGKYRNNFLPDVGNFQIFSVKKAKR